MFVRMLTIICLGLLSWPAQAQWFDWKEEEPDEIDINESTLTERLAYIEKLKGVSSWSLEGISKNQVVIRWTELPADHWRIVEGAALMAHREVNFPVTVYSIEADSKYSARSKYLCKVTARHHKIDEWDGDACGAPKKEKRGLFDNIDLF